MNKNETPNADCLQRLVILRLTIQEASELKSEIEKLADDERMTPTLTSIYNRVSEAMRLQPEQKRGLELCADWHEGAANRLDAANGITVEPFDSAAQAWSEQHRKWAAMIKQANAGS